MSSEQLWAPWRLEYILGGNDDSEPCDSEKLLPDADPECFLCRANATDNDRRLGIVQRGKHTVTLLNRYPYNCGHLLIAPRRHIARMDQLGIDTEAELSRQTTLMTSLLDRVLKPQGFNIGVNLGQAAGAGLPNHLHWHIVPRWIGDTNFMPVTAGVHTIPQSLDALWDLLAEELNLNKLE